MAKKKNKQKQATTVLKSRDAKSNFPWKEMLFMGILAMMLYFPSTKFQWALDDHSVVKENFVTKKGWTGISTHLTTPYRHGYWSSKGTLYRPLSLVMFAAEWAISPDNPGLHHFMNVLIYGLICALLFYFLALLTKSKLWSVLIASLFVLHPVHVEVVANIKSRDELLSFLFGLAALICWWKYLEKKKMLMLAGGLLLYGLSLFSKESSITLLAIFPALALLFFKKSFLKDWTKSLLFLIPAGIYLIVRSQVLGSVGAGSGESSPLDNLLFAAPNMLSSAATAILILGKYLFTLIFPFQLVSDLGYNQIPIVGFGNWQVLLSLVLYAGMAFVVLKFWKKYPLVSFGALFYLATISVFSNLIIRIGSSFGERFLFLPSLGFLIFAVGILKYWAEEKFGTLDKLAVSKSTQLPIIITSIFALFFAYKTIDRIPDWNDSLSLYSKDILVAENSAKLNYHYALENAKQGRDAKNPAEKSKYNQLAKKHYEKALEIYPNYVDSYSQLGLLAFRTGNKDRAMELYKKALEINPNKAIVYSNMGIIYFGNGQLDKAEEVYTKAIELDPKFVDAYQNLGAVYARKKKFEKAIQYFRKGLEYAPDNATLNFYLGSALRDSGNPSAGAPYLQKAKQLNPALGN